MKKLCMILLFCSLFTSCSDESAIKEGASFQQKFSSYLRKVNSNDEVPKKFFIDSGAHDLSKVPLVYPFVVRSTDRLRSGIVSGGGIHFSTDVDVTDFNFDGTHMIFKGKTDSDVWGYLSFAEELQTKFDSREAMLKEARRAGYNGSLELIPLERWFRLFTGRLKKDEVSGFVFLEKKSVSGNDRGDPHKPTE